MYISSSPSTNTKYLNSISFIYFTFHCEIHFETKREPLHTMPYLTSFHNQHSKAVTMNRSKYNTYTYLVRSPTIILSMRVKFITANDSKHSSFFACVWWFIAFDNSKYKTIRKWSCCVIWVRVVYSILCAPLFCKAS